MQEQSLRVGQVVRSCAGRDSGCFYVVVKLLGGNRVTLADGVRRKVANPKIKNVKHVKAYGAPDASSKVRTAGSRILSDTDVRDILRYVVEKEVCW